VKAFRTGNAEDTQVPLQPALKEGGALDSCSTNVARSKFEVAYMFDLARGSAGNKMFIDELVAAMPRFYELVGQGVGLGGRSRSLETISERQKSETNCSIGGRAKVLSGDLQP
jgi:hypothetical protein